MPRDIGTSSGVKLTDTASPVSLAKVLGDLGRVPVDAADAVGAGAAHHLAAEQVRLGRLAGAAGAGRGDHDDVGLDQARGDRGGERQRRHRRVAAGDGDPGRAPEQRRAGRAARAVRRARCRRACRRRTAPTRSASSSRKSAPQSITTVSSPSSRGDRAGLAVREAEEDHVVAGEHVEARSARAPGRRAARRCGCSEPSVSPALEPPVSAPISTPGWPSSRRSTSPPAYPLAPATATRFVVMCMTIQWTATSFASGSAPLEIRVRPPVLHTSVTRK